MIPPDPPGPAERQALEHRIVELPILVLLPHNRCNCRCVMCDIWKIRQVREITEEDLKPHLESLRALKVKWVVFSGGEALMHSDLPALCRLLRREALRLTLLTSGLSVARHAASQPSWGSVPHAGSVALRQLLRAKHNEPRILVACRFTVQADAEPVLSCAHWRMAFSPRVCSQ